MRVCHERREDKLGECDEETCKNVIVSVISVGVGGYIPLSGSAL